MASASSAAPKTDYRRLALIGVVVLGVGYWYSTSEETPPPRAKRSRQIASSSTTKLELYKDIDYSAKFAAMNTPLKNAFVPLVVREDSRQVIPTADNGIPPAFANGEQKWSYTGYAEVDGRSTALLENSGSGEGAFVQGGESWKTSRVISVTNQTIVLQGPSGVVRSVPLITFDSFDPAEKSATSPVTPLPLPLAGTIGVQPVAVNSVGSPNALPNSGTPVEMVAPAQTRPGRGRRGNRERQN